MKRIARKEKKAQELMEYTQFLTSMELLLIALTETSVKVDRDKYFAEQNHAISMEWGSKPLKSARNNFDVRAELKVTMSKPKAPTPFLELEAVYTLHIHCAKDFPAEYLERFCNAEVRLMVWPYFREYLTSMCGRMHIPPVFLPLAARD